MLGVVLWSDRKDHKAVIWCEDHGDLAYFNGGAEAPIEMPEFDAGDLVHFELHQESHLRLARNPRRIDQGAYGGLAGQLQVASAINRLQVVPTVKQPNAVPNRSESPAAATNVIPFKREHTERADRDLVVV